MVPPVNVSPPVDNPRVRTRIGRVSRALSLPSPRRRRKRDPPWNDAEGELAARRALYGERRAIDAGFPPRAIDSLPRKTAT